MASQNKATKKILQHALNDQRVQELHKKIAGNVSLSVVPSDDGYWGAHLDNGHATIWVAPASMPSAALAHELLHLDVQLKGFQRARAHISNIAQPAVFKALMDALDNELQHHRFYDAYLALGFKPQHFYADSDGSTAAALREHLAIPNQTRVARALAYLSLSAPGGGMHADEKREIREMCDDVDDGVHAHAWSMIDDCIARWKVDPSLDSRPYLKEILLALAPDTDEKPHLTWYTFSSAAPDMIFPSGGEFVARPFQWKAPE